MKKLSVLIAFIAVFYYFFPKEAGQEIGERGIAQIEKVGPKEGAGNSSKNSPNKRQKPTVKMIGSNPKYSQKRLSPDKFVKRKNASRVPTNVSVKSIGPQKYLASDKYRAIESQQYDSSMGKEVDRFDGLTIFESTSPSYKQVVFHPSKQVRGVVTGEIVVRLKSGGDLQKLIDLYDLELKSSHAHLGIYYLEPKDPSRLEEIALKLHSNSREIYSSKLGILYGGDHAK